MARPREKSQSLFSQWNSLVSSQSDVGDKKDREQRPRHTSDCLVLSEAEKWRKQVVRDALQRVYWISNAGLGEQQTRDMNDEINKLMGLKHHWDRRIVELGGENHAKVKGQLDVEGKELPGSKGYKYYGAAADMPGIREKFEEAEKEMAQQKKKEKKKMRKEFLNDAGDEYYKTEEDDSLEAAESAREKALVRESVDQFEAVKRRKMTGNRKALYNSDEEEEELHAFLRGDVSAGSNAAPATSGPDQAKGQTKVADMLVETKKSALLSKYA